MSALAEKTCLVFRGDAKELAEAIAIPASICPARSTRPLLQNLLLHGHDGVLEVVGTDLEVGVRCRIEQVEIHADGKFLVNGARFMQILRELAGEQVEFSADERGGCTISTADARYQVMGADGDEFPELPAWKGKADFKLKAEQLSEMIRRTHFAAHPEKTRYAMNGILLDIKKDRIQLVATDGKRLSMCEQPLDFKVKKSVHIVVPTRGCVLLQRLVSGGKGKVAIRVESSQLHVQTATAMISARLVEGHFPPYEEVLPREEYEKKLTLPREAFLCALRRASLLGNKESRAVRFHFSREGLELTARVPEIGESRVHFPLDYPYDELEIGFNPGYFADAIKVLATTEFNLELRDNRSAAVLREKGEKGQLFLYLVMPLNLSA